MRKFNVGVLGATGIVGEEILEILIERNFPFNNLYAIASQNSKGNTITLSNDEKIDVETLSDIENKQIDILLSSAGAEVSKQYLPDIAKKGTIIIDNTSYFRADPLIPLIIPEINPQDLPNYKNKNIIANPNCSTIIMLMAVAPLHKYIGVDSIVVSTYQSVSGAGKHALDELFNQTKEIYANRNIIDTKKVFTKQIAFNAIPHIDKFLENRYTKEEWKMLFETQKILDKNIKVSATCVRVPVFIGHAVSVSVTLKKPINVTQAKQIWDNIPGVSVVDYCIDEGYVTPVEASGEDNIFISRIREDTALPNGLTFWVVGDNIRKGAALNAVQIAELLIKDKL